MRATLDARFPARWALVSCIAALSSCRQEIYFLDVDNRTDSPIAVWHEPDASPTDAAGERLAQIGRHGSTRIPFAQEDGGLCSHVDVEAKLRTVFATGLTFVDAAGRRVHVDEPHLRAMATPYSDGSFLIVLDAHLFP